MLKITIPGTGTCHIEHVVFDYNGTIATDGHLINGVRQGIKQYSDILKFHVITADTFGFVKEELTGLNIVLAVIPEGNQEQRKLDYIKSLGPERTICAGNGANDRLMLEKAHIGIAVLGDEGLAASSLLSCDIMVKDVLDIFGFFKIPQRLVASLRT